jgi:hypothetical protein
VESAGIVDRATLDAMVDQALCAPRATAASVLATLRRAGTRVPGAARLRASLEVWTHDIRPGSPPEVRFLRRLVEWGAPELVTQHEVRDGEGCFVARLDLAIPSLRQAYEYDSDMFHGPRRYAHDEVRHARLVALGWRVDHVSVHDLLPSATRLRDLLHARMRRLGAITLVQ